MTHARGALASIVAAALLFAPAIPARGQSDVGRHDAESAKLLPSLEREPQAEFANPLHLLDRPVDPEVYRVGPGDRLLIHILSDESSQSEVRVTPEGTIVLPSVGEIDVRGQSLNQAKRTIARAVKRLYTGAHITTTLTAVRAFRVGITGAVNNPGFRVVGAMTRCSEVLEAAGLRQQASRRRIALQRGDSTLRVDLLAFERTGDLTENPYLVEGDILHVPPSSGHATTIAVAGAVGTPGTFEFVAGETVGRALQLAGDLHSVADSGGIELVRFTSDHRTTVAVDLPFEHGFDAVMAVPLESDDRIFVRRRPDYRLKHNVDISGEILSPGEYPIIADETTLADVIAAAGGATDEADLNNAQIVRPEQETQNDIVFARLSAIPAELRTRAENDRLLALSITPPGRVVTNFTRLLVAGDTSYNVYLRPNDRIHIPARLTQVNVTGRAVQPGLVYYREGAKLDYYLSQAGGFAWQADKKNVFLVKGQTGVAIKKGRVKSIEPGDTIVIPTKRDPRTWDTIKDVIGVLGGVATVYLAIEQVTR